MTHDCGEETLKQTRLFDDAVDDYCPHCDEFVAENIEEEFRCEPS